MDTLLMAPHKKGVSLRDSKVVKLNEIENETKDKNDVKQKHYLRSEFVQRLFASQSIFEFNFILYFSPYFGNLTNKNKIVAVPAKDLAQLAASSNMPYRQVKKTLSVINDVFISVGVTKLPPEKEMQEWDLKRTASRLQVKRYQGKKIKYYLISLAICLTSKQFFVAPHNFMDLVNSTDLGTSGVLRMSKLLLEVVCCSKFKQKRYSNSILQTNTGIAIKNSSGYAEKLVNMGLIKRYEVDNKCLLIVFK